MDWPIFNHLMQLLNFEEAMQADVKIHEAMLAEAMLAETKPGNMCMDASTQTDDGHVSATMKEHRRRFYGVQVEPKNFTVYVRADGNIIYLE